MCEDTLKDVDELLTKCESLGTKSKRFIDRMRFTTADIARLESRLASSGVYLQQCHLSLVLLSSRRVEEKLLKIESDYKQDKRAKSVLSAALVDGQDVDQEQLMDQAESDLMSEDVHPDAITLYRQGIKSWILAASNEADTGETRQRPRISRASTSLVQRTQRHNSHQVSKNSSSSQTQTEQTGARDSDETLGLAMAPFQLPPLDADGALSGLASIANSEAPSREASIKSHASKDSDWHPSSSEDPCFVTAMILKPFSVDPLKEEMPLARKIFYFTRAFNQIDYSEHGVRSRPDVISACQEVMKAMTSDISPYHCDRFIYESDKNHDYMINKEEFLGSMIEASKAAHAILRDKALGRIRTDVQSANAAAVDRQLDSTGNGRRCIRSSLPWGFRYTETDDERVYDCVDQLWPDHQPQPLPLYSFTSLAQEVGTRGTGILNSSSSRWSAVLPKDRLREFNSTFDRVKSIAVRFDLLYRPGYTDGLSDLDEMLAVLNIIQSALPSKEIKEHLISLRQLQTKCESIGHLMRGFTFRLEALENEIPRRPSPQTLKDDLTAWRQAHMDGWACFIADSRDFRALWTEIVEGITECRKWYAGFCVPSTQEIITPHSQHERSKWYNTLQMQALDVARAYVGGIRNDNARRLIEHERQPQQIKIKRLCLIEENHQTAPKRSLFSKRSYLLALIYLLCFSLANEIVDSQETSALSTDKVRNTHRVPNIAIGEWI